MKPGLLIDLFAGGGGASVAIREAFGREPHVAINHWDTALAVHRANHPKTRHLEADLWEVKPRDVVKGRHVAALWLSPDCKEHSIAKGGKPRDNKIRCLAWVGVEWARAVRPDAIFLENVREWERWGPLDENDQPIKPRAGETFRQFVGELRLLGYQVEWRVLDACDYGAPTRRKRLFLVARCDGEPIVWPEPTHGPGRIPYRTAAECIDWSLPGRSIFGRKKPLAEKTMWRIAEGLRRFVFESPAPFIVQPNHGKREFRGQAIGQPLSTITAKRRRHALVTPTLIQSGYGERKGQRARVLDIHAPLGTIVAKGQKHALVAAWLAKHFGDPLRTKGGGRVAGTTLDKPISTITARDHHSLVGATICKLRGDCHSSDPRVPLPTVAAQGNHLAEVRAFLSAYYSGGPPGQTLDRPMRTITSKARHGLVTVHGVDYQITDITLRMLEDHELLRAQFGEYAEGYDLSAATTKADRVALVGNSVSPYPAIALLRANLPRERKEAA